VKLIGFILMAAIFSTAAEDIVISSGEWAPFISPNLKHEGVYSHIVREAFALENVEVEYLYFPWVRTYKELINDRVDASILWTKNEERESEVLFSDPIAPLLDVFFYRRDKFIDWQNMSDLKGLEIGITAGYIYGDHFDRAVADKTFTTSRANSDRANFKRLLAGRIDAFPITLDVAMTLLKDFTQSEREQLIYSEKIIRKVDMYLIMNKNNPVSSQKMQILNANLVKLKNSGRYDQYLLDHKNGLYQP
jgi:polar amino acid transport system substrate-binding protein